MNARKFLAGMEPAIRLGGIVEYDIDGVLWYGLDMETHDTLTHHPVENIILDVRRLDEGRFQWEYSLKIADGVYVRHFDSAEELIDACRAALAYRPTEYVFEWTDLTTWYETSPDHLTAVIDGEEASIRRIDPLPLIDEQTRYNWSRKWAPAAQVLSAIGPYTHELSGYADTQDLALLAVVEAPQRLKMACAALVATLRKQEADRA